MEKKTFTVLITSNRKGQTQNLTVSASWVKAFTVFGFIVLILFGAACVDYVSLLLETNENKQLRAENSQLKKQFEVIETKLDSLENSLERVKSYSTKLKLITNINDDERAMKLTLGGMPKPGQAIDEYSDYSEERAPASTEFLMKDDVFLQKAPLDEAGGELSAISKLDYSTLSIRIDNAVRETQLREQSILDLNELLAERQNILNATPSIKPARGWFTSRFGYRLDPFSNKPTMHYGLDIAGAPGTSVFAPANGVVSYVGYEAGYGKVISIDHGYGVTTRFAHNSQVFVDVGQKVSRWDLICAIGSTGRSSGPHLHYEVRVHGVPVDPINYILEE